MVYDLSRHVLHYDLIACALDEPTKHQTCQPNPTGSRICPSSRSNSPTSSGSTPARTCTCSQRRA